LTNCHKKNFEKLACFLYCRLFLYCYKRGWLITIIGSFILWMTQPNFVTFKRLKMNKKRLFWIKILPNILPKLQNYTKFVTLLCHNWNKILPSMETCTKKCAINVLELTKNAPKCTKQFQNCTKVCKKCTRILPKMHQCVPNSFKIWPNIYQNVTISAPEQHKNCAKTVPKFDPKMYQMCQNLTKIVPKSY